jgi:hypothetical protein
VLLKVFKGKAKQVHRSCVVSVAFIIAFQQTPIAALFS